MDVRNAPGLQILTLPDGPALHLPGPGKLLDSRLLDEPGMLDVLLLCDEWAPRAEVERTLVRGGVLSEPEAARAVDELLEHEVLVSSRLEEQRAVHEAYAAWSARGWGDAFLFQNHIDRLPHLDYADGGYTEDRDRIRGFLERDPVPSNYKTLSGAERLLLRRDVAIEHEPLWSLLAIEDEASFPDRPLTFDELSWMTHLAFGQIGTISTHYGERLSKTSPSGGARHPTEAYLLALDVEGVPAGAYHYSVADHALELIEPGDLRALVRDHVVRKPRLAPFTHRAVYVTATRAERTMWRYRESFSYRSVNHDLGHLMESTRLLARALRRNHFRGYAPEETVLESCLRLDGLEEAVMTYSIVG